MSNVNLHFRGQMEDEEVIAFSRKHWIALLPEVIPMFFFICFVTLTAMLLDKVSLPDMNDSFFQLLVIVTVSASGWLIHRFFLRLFKYFMNVVIITNHRLIEIKKTLFLKDTKESLDLRKVQEVEFKQVGLLRNLLKFGDLQITLGNSETKTILMLPNPDFHFRLLNRLKNEQFLRQQRPLFPNDSIGMPASTISYSGEHIPL